MIELKLYKAMGGQKEFTGRLLGKDGDTLRIECGGKEIELRTADAAKINLAVII